MFNLEPRDIRHAFIPVLIEQMAVHATGGLSHQDKEEQEAEDRKNLEDWQRRKP
jgi:hypothetical protein